MCGDQDAPDRPSEQSVKIPESMVIVEFLAELFPEKNLYPADPIQRARARAFIVTSNEIMYTAWRACVIYRTSKDLDPIFKALDYIQSRLPDNALYAIGDHFSAADISVAPWFPRFEMLFEKDFFGHYEIELVRRAEALYRSAKYDKIRKYGDGLRARPSVANTFPEVSSNIYVPSPRIHL